MTMKRALILLASLFLWDGLATALLVSSGAATEANPVLAPIVHAWPWSVVVVKLVVLPALYVLWRERQRLVVRVATGCLLGIYAALGIFHIFALHLV